jgi:hypothetical protein
MREPPELNELVGTDLTTEEIERLRGVDAALRSVPAPPHDVPARLTAAVAEVPLAERRGGRRGRIALALAFAAALVAASFGIGQWAGSRFETAYTVDLAPTASAPGAEAAVKVGERDEKSGNVELLVDVTGLPRLNPDQFYALWLERDGEWAATCGYFAVGEGKTTIRMTVSYDFLDFDAWNISEAARDDDAPRLLTAEIPDA